MNALFRNIAVASILPVNYIFNNNEKAQINFLAMQEY